MDRNDWIDLLAAGVASAFAHGKVIEYDLMGTAAVLDTRIPAACPDCKGGGVISHDAQSVLYGPVVFDFPCTHPNAPTVEQVLTVGLRTLSAEVDDEYGSFVEVDGRSYGSVAGLLRALRGEDA